MKTIKVETKGPVTTVTLDRPDVRNAFNEVVIDELQKTFTSFGEKTRVAVLTGGGSIFCAGADVEWMRKSKSYTEEENAKDAAAMAAMLRAIDECPCPVIGRINGTALGGGSGLTACCDIAVAVENAKFGFTEVRLGIVPAVVSNFVLPKIGERAARRYFLTGERFTAEEAKRIGLVHEVVPPAGLDAKVDDLVQQIMQCGPRAVGISKKVIRERPKESRDRAIEHTIRTIAGVRISPEAQEGLSAFLEKRKPRWS